MVMFIILIVAMTSQVYVYTKIRNFNHVQFIECQLYHSKAFNILVV